MIKHYQMGGVSLRIHSNDLNNGFVVIGGFSVVDLNKTVINSTILN